MKIIFFGDIYGKAGREVILKSIADLKEEFQPDFIIANGENLASGRGITEKTARQIFAAGVDAFTSGNHLWDKKESLEYIQKEKKILKPINYPEKAVGNRFYICEKNELKLAIICVAGQAFMPPSNSPFEAMDKILNQVECKHIFVDMHAEATAEKRALGYYLDGRISALVGTHTHIQTADEEILPNGTGYLTDVGMTGPHDSVIGVKKEIILEKITSGMPARYESSKYGLQINAVFLEFDDESGKSVEIQRIKREVV